MAREWDDKCVWLGERQSEHDALQAASVSVRTQISKFLSAADCSSPHMHVHDSSLALPTRTLAHCAHVVHRVS